MLVCTIDGKELRDPVDCSLFTVVPANGLTGPQRVKGVCQCGVNEMINYLGSKPLVLLVRVVAEWWQGAVEGRVCWGSDDFLA